MPSGNTGDDPDCRTSRRQLTAPANPLKAADLRPAPTASCRPSMSNVIGYEDALRRARIGRRYTRRRRCTLARLQRRRDGTGLFVRSGGILDVLRVPLGSLSTLGLAGPNGTPLIGVLPAPAVPAGGTSCAYATGGAAKLPSNSTTISEWRNIYSSGTAEPTAIGASAFHREYSTRSYCSTGRAANAGASLNFFGESASKVIRRPGRDGAKNDRRARRPSWPRPPARRGCRRKDRGGPWS